MPRTLLSEVVLELRRATGDAVPPSAATVQKAIANLPACVFVADQRGRLVAASHVALAAIGVSAAALRTLSVSDVSAPTEPAENLWETFRRDGSQSGQYSLLGKSGPLRTRYAAVVNAVGDLSVAVHILAADERPRHIASLAPGDVIIRGGTSSGGFVVLQAITEAELTARIASFRKAVREATRLAGGCTVWREHGSGVDRTFVRVPLE